MVLTVVCFACGTSNEVTDRVGRRDECSKCMADLHVCKNCDFYDVSSYNECLETSADRIPEKETSNFCDFFKPGSGSYEKDNSDNLNLLAQAEALFKKGT